MRGFKTLTGYARMRETLSGTLLVIEFMEEFTMGNISALSAGSILTSCPQNIAAQSTFHYTQFHELPIRDAGMAAEISKLLKSQILYQANTAVYAQGSSLNPSFLSLMRNSG